MPNKLLLGCIVSALSGYSILLTAGEETSPTGVLLVAEKFAGADAHIQCERAAVLADLEEGYTFAFKIDAAPQDLMYTIADMGGPAIDDDNGQLMESITFSDTTTNRFAWATEGAPLDAVIVKGGPGAHIYYYDPQVAADGILQSPDNRGGRKADISHVTLCWNPPPQCQDIPAPIISFLGLGEVTTVRAGVVWLTDIPATSQVQLTEVATGKELFSEINQNLTQSHSVIIEGLQPNSLYMVRAFSSSCSGLTGTSNGLSFRTRR